MPVVPRSPGFIFDAFKWLGVTFVWKSDDELLKWLNFSVC